MRTTVGRRTIDHVLADARESIERLTPREAYDAAQLGAALVDIRSADEQRRQGVLIPGALHHPLSVVAWRLDPACPTSNPKVPLDTRTILLCREGYSSSLAASWLRGIGFERVGDVVGGVDAWHTAGLPVVAA